MNGSTIPDEDLLAYLDGERMPEVDAALSQSPELRQRLEELRADVAMFEHIFHKAPTVQPQDLVDVATGQATPQQRLLVSAYLRAHPAAQKEMNGLLTEARRSQARLQKRLPIFQALAFQPDMRPVRSQTAEMIFQSASLNARVNVRVAPMEQERGSISGIVTQNNQPAVNARVMLRAPSAHPRPRYTDNTGRFLFPKLKAGTYRLEVWFDQGTVQLPDLVLSDE